MFADGGEKLGHFGGPEWAKPPARCFRGEKLHPPTTYGVTVVSRSIKAAA